MRTSKPGTKSGTKHLGSFSAKLENVRKGESIVIICEPKEQTKLMKMFEAHKHSGNLIGEWEYQRAISIIGTDTLLNGVIFSRIF